MRLKHVCLYLISCMLFSCKEKGTLPWNGKECAVVLTYDDSLDEHLDNVVPSLNKYHLKGTFYIIGRSECFMNRTSEWKAASSNGHELGNHTLMHPCARPKRRVALPPEKDLAKYTLKKVVSEIEETNRLLNEVDGETERTFAFPCGQKKVQDTFFYNYVKEDFVGARGVKRDMKTVCNINLDDINAYGMKGHTAQEMIGLVNDAIENKELLVFLFHGVGGGSTLNVEKKQHDILLKYLHTNKEKIWVAPMVDVANYIKNRVATK